MLDPNSLIHGDGFAFAERRDISVEMFPKTKWRKWRNQSRTSLGCKGNHNPKARATSEFIQAKQGASADEWYRVVNSVNGTEFLPRLDVNIHDLVEGWWPELNGEPKEKRRCHSARHIPKAPAGGWLYAASWEIRSVEDMLWMKFQVFASM